MPHNETENMNNNDHAYENLRLDDGFIESFLNTYPEAVRDNVRFVAGYLRDRCGRNLDVLEAHVKALGHKTTASTFSKVLRGKWFQMRTDKKGVERMEGSPANFNQVVESLRNQARIDAQAGRVPFIETGTAWDIFAYIDRKAAASRVNKFGCVIGHTGSQKSACFQEYARRNNHGRTTHFESPYKPTMGRFITSMAAAFGVPASLNMELKLVRIMDAVNDRKVVIVDNVQRLYRAKQGANQDVFNFLLQLQDETRCTIILSWTPDFMETFLLSRDKGYFEQFEGRIGGHREFLVLDDYPPREDIIQIARAFKVQNASRWDAEKDAPPALAYLEDISKERGRVRIIFEALQEARQIADEAKSKTISLDHIKAARGE